MILEILHVNGNDEEIMSKYHDSLEYQRFITKLKDKILMASKAGVNIVYRPNLGGMPRNITETYFTQKEDSKKRHPCLKQHFPLLKGLDEVEFTLLPDGLYAPAYSDELDRMISADPSKVMVIGGIYKQACVAAVARDTKSRNPAAKVFIGDDVSFENRFPPIQGYLSIPHTTLERYFV
jgi:hypothetical protein